MDSQKGEDTAAQVRRWLRIVIFGTDTRSGKAFDIALLVAIILSVTTVMLESVKEYREGFGSVLRFIEWFFTVLFTIEYFTRIYLSRDKKQFILSWYGIIDLLAILPTWLFFVLPGGQFLSAFRIMRVIRVFRILEMSQFTEPANMLSTALRQSVNKILVFLLAVLLIVTVIGSLMYVIEGPENGYKSIPVSVYWAIVTITTVGYGDISPQTALGQAVSSLAMIIGYSIIAIPTGIITREVMRNKADKGEAVKCPSCRQVNQTGANFCNKCGINLKAD